MHILRPTARVAAIAALAVASAGCSGAQKSLALSPQGPAVTKPRSSLHTGTGAAYLMPQTAHRVHAAYDSKKALLFVANFGHTDSVEVYDSKTNEQIATITVGVQSPEGVCLDKDLTLYVVNENLPLAEYKAGQTSPFQEITQGLDYPAFCAIDSSGNLWVTNALSPNVTEYPKGKTSPSTIITDGITRPIGIAFDSQGVMYVSNNTASGTGGNVQVYRRGATSPTRTITSGIGNPIGIVVDSKGTLYVTNIYLNTVAEYRAGASKPFRTISDGLNIPDGVTVEEKGELFVANWEDNIAEYAPGATKPSGSIPDANNPEGVAISPPILPKK
jgi:YVTN family beta-propeller protein